ncbi:hypothetical protein HMPREF1584_00762 [Gardnerella vaginalis JCP8481A]|nr:hypothetical protein HMPREF1584_00762 [Gardnerella vaginalis JCP8481A]
MLFQLIAQLSTQLLAQLQSAQYLNTKSFWKLIGSLRKTFLKAYQQHTESSCFCADYHYLITTLRQV